MLFIIDSFAWIEYFIGSLKGEMLRRLFLDEQHTFATIECCLAEIQGWALTHGKDFRTLLTVILANSSVLSVREQDWISAGKERFEQRKTQKDFGLIDAAIIVKQREFDATIVTGDKHFCGKRNVLFLE